MFKRLVCLCVVLGLSFGVMGSLGCGNSVPQGEKVEKPPEKPEEQEAAKTLPSG